MIIYNDDELIYAATARCQCGAGLAYPKRIKEGDHSHDPFIIPAHWDCSDILTGRAIPSGQPGAKMHNCIYPFNFYEIKPENQPSAYGQTTRPKNGKVK